MKAGPATYFKFSRQKRRSWGTDSTVCKMQTRHFHAPAKNGVFFWTLRQASEALGICYTASQRQLLFCCCKLRRVIRLSAICLQQVSVQVIWDQFWHNHLASGQESGRSELHPENRPPLLLCTGFGLSVTSYPSLWHPAGRTRS